MGDKQVKRLRKQLRNIVQELYPEVVTNEMLNDLQAKNAEKLAELTATVKSSMEKTMDSIDQRSKDIQSFIMRESVASKNVNVDESVKIDTTGSAATPTVGE